MTLAVATPAGQAALEQQTEVAWMWAALWDLDVAETPAQASAPADAIYSLSGRMRLLVEVKCRNLTAPQLESYGSLKVNAQGIANGIELATTLHLPFVLVLGMYPGPLLRWWPLSEPDQGAVHGQQPVWVQSQPTVNQPGQSVRRQCLFLPTMRMHTLGER